MQRVLIVSLLAAVLGVNLALVRAAPIQASGAMPAKVPQLVSGAQVNAYLTKAHFHGYILLARHGQTILSKGYGMADAQHQVQITSQTRWPMFGIEDFMVAIVILKLQEEGRLNVQGKLCAYMKGCPQVWQSITIRAVLGGTSEIGQYDPFASPGSIKQTIAQCKAAPLLSAPPGVSEDSSCNRVLLSSVIERVSQRPFATVMEKVVFHPAGMKSTGLVTRAQRKVALGYKNGSPAPPLHYDGYPLIYSTPGDIVRLDRALLAGKIISQASLHALITPYRHDGDPAVSVYNGYGCQVLKANHFFFHDSSGGDISGVTGTSALRTNRAVFESSGPDWSGFLTDSWFSPDDGTVAIWLNNDSGLFDYQSDNRFLDRTAQLLWGK